MMKKEPLLLPSQHLQKMEKDFKKTLATSHLIPDQITCKLSPYFNAIDLIFTREIEVFIPAPPNHPSRSKKNI